MDAVRAQRETPGDSAATPRRPHGRAPGDSQDYRPDGQTILLARDVPRHYTICPTVPELPGSRSASDETSRESPHNASHRALVTLDLIGPLPRFTNGHVWLLVMQDRFSKWIELKPLRRATAPAVTRAIAEEIIHRHGCPDQIISDNGTQLKSAQLAELLREFHIEHRTTQVRAPHCNLVERTNRTFKTMVS